MSPKTKQRIHFIYGLVLSLLILAVGGCFALSCLSIYESGPSPYTRESIAAHFDRIAVPVYICIAGVLGGIVLSLALPLEGSKVKSHRDAAVALEKLSARLDPAACDEATVASIRGERRFRKGTTVTVGVLSALTMVPALVWCVNPAHFSVENLNGDIKTAAFFVIPCAVVALGLWVAAVLLCGASVSRETSAVKAALVSMRGKAVNSGQVKSDKKNWASDPRFVWGMRGAVLVVGVLFVVLGVRNGGMADVLGKAIRICTECIGLG